MSVRQTIRRSLSTFEKICWLLDRYFHYKIVIHAEILGRVQEGCLRAALDSVQQRHPLLRARITRRGWWGAVYRTGGVPRIPLTVKEIARARVVEEIESLHHAALPYESGPLIQCVLLRHDEDRATLLLVYSHAVGDARAGMFLLRDLIDSVESIQQGRSVNWEESPLPPALESRFPPEVKGIRGMGRGLIALLLALSATLRSGWVPWLRREEWTGSRNRRTCLVTCRLNKDRVQRLKAGARANGTTVNAGLLAAYMLAILRDRGPRGRVPFYLTYAIDMRRFVDPPFGEEFGLRVSLGTILTQAAAASAFWEAAQAIHRAFQDSLKRKMPFLFFVGLAFWKQAMVLLGATRMFAWFFATLFTDLMNPPLVYLSNLGEFEIRGRGEIVIASAGFSNSSTALGVIGPFVATVNGTMILNLVGMAPLSSRESLQRIADLMLEVLVGNLPA